MSSVGLGQSLSSNTNANLTTRFGSNSAQIAGVVSLNALAGNLAVVGDASIGILNIGSGQLQVSTAGNPQVVSSVTASGSIVGSTVTSTGLLTCAGASVAGGLVAGSATIGNMLPSNQVVAAYPVGNSVCVFTQVGGVGMVNGSGTSNANGYITIGLPPGRTGLPISGSVTPAGNNLAGQSPIYGVVFLAGSAAPGAPGVNQMSGGTINSTNGNSASGIQAYLTGTFLMTN